MGCRAKGRESQQRAVEAVRQSQGASPGALGVGAVDVVEGHLQPTPAKPGAASPRPGASPRGLGAGAAVSSWRRRTLRRSPRAPHPPGTSQPWPRGHKTCWQQRPSTTFPSPRFRVAPSPECQLLNVKTMSSMVTLSPSQHYARPLGATLSLLNSWA